jgi:hypothetical protein
LRGHHARTESKQPKTRGQPALPRVPHNPSLRSSIKTCSLAVSQYADAKAAAFLAVPCVPLCPLWRNELWLAIRTMATAVPTLRFRSQGRLSRKGREGHPDQALTQFETEPHACASNSRCDNLINCPGHLAGIRGISLREGASFPNCWRSSVGRAPDL